MTGEVACNDGGVVGGRGGTPGENAASGVPVPYVLVTLAMTREGAGMDWIASGVALAMTAGGAQ